jgi:aminoglycoside 2''-phosphotransferase
MASVLLEVHSFPVEKALELEVLKLDWRRDYQDFFEKVRVKTFPHLAKEVCQNISEVFEAFLSDDRNFVFSPALVHRDLSGEEHILCDPDMNRIVGIIDWEDSCIGDPAIDFTGIYWDCGERFTHSLLDHYEDMGGNGPQVDPTFWDRNVFYHRIIHFNTIIYGMEIGDESYIKRGVKEIDRIFGSLP